MLHFSPVHADVEELPSIPRLKFGKILNESCVIKNIPICNNDAKISPPINILIDYFITRAPPKRSESTVSREPYLKVTLWRLRKIHCRGPKNMGHLLLSKCLYSKYISSVSGMGRGSHFHSAAGVQILCSGMGATDSIFKAATEFSLLTIKVCLWHTTQFRKHWISHTPVVEEKWMGSLQIKRQCCIEQVLRSLFRGR